MPFILVVDEEPMILELVSTVLRTAGFSVLTADTSCEALALKRQHRREIQLLITDIGIPHVDGLSLAERLLAIDPALSVLFLSANVSESDFQGRRRAALLAKPFNPRELLAQARALIAGSYVRTNG